MLKFQVREMQESDLHLVLAWRNHPDIRKFMYTQHEISFKEHSAWFAKAHLDEGKKLLIFEVSGVPMGFVNLTFHKHGEIADWGFYISPEADKGTGRSLGQTTLQYVFNELGLHKVCGEALDYNEPSIRFHLKLGFKEEGALRDQFFDGQNYHTVHYFGLLHSEWDNFKAS